MSKNNGSLEAIFDVGGRGEARDELNTTVYSMVVVHRKTNMQVSVVIHIAYTMYIYM